MWNGFKRILVLIDFSPASLHAAKEAAILAAKFNSEVHFLHAIIPYPSLSYFFSTEKKQKEIIDGKKIELQNLKINLEQQYRISIRTYEIKDHLKEKIQDYAKEFNIDLVVIGAKKRKGFKNIPSESLTEVLVNTLDCEVLSVYPGSDCGHLKKIVLPLGKFIPVKKIRLAYALSKKFAANIHLIGVKTVDSKNQTEDIKVLLDAFRHLKDTNIPVECQIVEGTNIAEATVRYAKNVDAGLILVNPGNESYGARSIIRKLRSYITTRTTIPVLSVSAINNIQTALID